MNFIKKNWILTVFLSLIGFSGCYKKDLEEFKKIESVHYTADWALPFVEKELTLNDTIPTIPGFTTVTMSDTNSVEIPASSSKDSLESIVNEVTMRVLLKNSFPASGNIQVYFVDSTDAIKDSLFGKGNYPATVKMGNPDATSILEATITKAKYKHLSKTCEKMLLFYTITTSNVSGMDTKRLKINMGLRAKLDMSIPLKN